MANYQLQYGGQEIDRLLEKIDELENATQSVPGMMSAADKTKLDGMASNAQANVIEGISVAGSVVTPTNKVVEIPIASAPAYGNNNPVSANGVYNAIKSIETLPLHVVVTPTFSEGEIDGLIITETTGRVPHVGDEVIVEVNGVENEGFVYIGDPTAGVTPEDVFVEGYTCRWRLQICDGALFGTLEGHVVGTLVFNRGFPTANGPFFSYGGEGEEGVPLGLIIYVNGDGWQFWYL